MYFSSHHLTADALPSEITRGVGAQEERLDREFEPTIGDLEAYLYAVRVYRDYQRFPNLYPRAGGLEDQPFLWHLALSCVLDAEAHADREAHEISLYAAD